MIFGQKLAIRSLRIPAQGGSPTTHLPNPPQVPTLTARQFMGIIMHPVRPYYGMDKMFGADVYQLRLVFVDWPMGTTEDYPIAAGDFLVLPVAKDSNGNTISRNYEVRGVENFPMSHIEVYIGVAPKTNQG